MKALRTVLTILALGVLFIYSGCGGGGGGSETIQDKQLGLLAGTSSKTWKVSTVYHGSTSAPEDSTIHWTNFTLTLTGTKGATSFAYSCTGRPKLSAWPPSGTWSFDSSSPSSTVIRDPGTADQINVGYNVDAAGKNLQLTLTYNGSGYTRVDNVTGQWTFNMIPQ